jgi:ferredoxin
VANAIIVGSGAAAAGVAIALSDQPDVQITVLDIGERLEPEKQLLVDTLAAVRFDEWSGIDLEGIVGQPIASRVHGLPEKRTFGSDYPFRNVGQLTGIVASADINPSLISGAYGGFSNIWGAQIMPFSAAVFDDWGIPPIEFEPHYRAILKVVPFAAENDDLSEMFPLFGDPMPLPEVSERTHRVLRAYGRNRRELRSLGITLGKARLAFRASECVRCGLCMTGCPYSLIYSASQTFDDLRRRQRVRYHGGMTVVKVAENDGTATVTALDRADGRIHQFQADRVYLACGAIGTTRIVMNSLALHDVDVVMHESQQFAIPMLSRFRVKDPRGEPAFTLNQFNMAIALDDLGFDVSQIHFYTHNDAFIQALPRILHLGITRPLMVDILRRLTLAIGYLPSWHSPRLRLRSRPAASSDSLPELFVTRDDTPWFRNRFFRTVLRRTIQAASLLDLYPLLPKLMVSAGGKSYHWGATFPYTPDRQSILSSDRIGRVGPWKRIHLVDASVFPNVPATTYQLTVMANSHRIGLESIHLPH